MISIGSVLYVRAAGAEGGGRGVIDALEAEFDVVVAEGAVDAVKRLSVEPGAFDCVVTEAALSDLPLDGFLDRVEDTAPETPVVVVGKTPTDATAAGALVDVDAYVPADRADALAERIDRLGRDAGVDRAVEEHRRLAEVVAALAVDVAGAADRAEIEAAVHDRLFGVDRYRDVWIGTLREGGSLSVTAPVVRDLDREELRALVGGDPAFVDQAVETGTVISTEGSVPTRSGTAASSSAPVHDGGPSPTLSVAAVPFIHDGRVWGVALLSTGRPDPFDGSERALLADVGAVAGHAIWAVESARAVDEARASDESIENLIHEIRNPLGIAQSHLSIAREDEDLEALDRVESALERLIETVDRASVGVGGPPTIEASPGDLREDVTLAWQSIDAPEADLDVVGTAPFEADHDLLVRLLANLLRNAVEHGGEDVSIRVGPMEDGRGFFVEDDGPGIPPEGREAVLERGYSTAPNGLGIGLNIVEDVASAHGWEVSITEGRDGGARFEVTGVDRVREEDR